jgi:hypothetical protein
LPENPYHEAWVEQWQAGHLRNLDAAARWLASTWPLAWLAWAATRRRDRAGARRGGGDRSPPPQPHRIGLAAEAAPDAAAAPSAAVSTPSEANPVRR